MEMWRCGGQKEQERRYASTRGRRRKRHRSALPVASWLGGRDGEVDIMAFAERFYRMEPLQASRDVCAG